MRDITLENYIKRQNGFISEDSIVISEPKQERLQASKGASIQDFIKMVSILVELSLPTVEFIPDEGKILTFDAMKQVNHPVISYNVISREPKLEKKPRYRSNYEEEDKIYEVWGQNFECLIQFNIIASVYNEAEEVMEKFEEIIFQHSAFLLKNGVGKILFKEHTTDSHLDTLRETLSVRSLIYYVEIEKLTVISKEKINEIEILAQKMKDEEEI